MTSDSKFQPGGQVFPGQQKSVMPPLSDSPREKWRQAINRSAEIMLGMLRSTGDLMREAAEHAPEPLRTRLIEEARLADIAVSLEVARRLEPTVMPTHPEFTE